MAIPSALRHTEEAQYSVVIKREEIMRILPVSQHMLEHVRQRSAHTLNSLMPHERRCVSRMYGIADIERFMPARFCAGTEKSNN